MLDCFHRCDKHTLVARWSSWAKRLLGRTTMQSPSTKKRRNFDFYLDLRSHKRLELKTQIALRTNTTPLLLHLWWIRRLIGRVARFK